MTKTNERQIRLFLASSAAAFLAAALISALLLPEEPSLFAGLAQILLSPAQLTKDYFLTGGVPATFLNMALVGAVYAALTCLPGTTVKGSTIAAWFLTVGFSSWGINVLNIWPFILGVFLHALARRKPFAQFVDLSMFSTALCPLASELLLRYPNAEDVQGVTGTGVVLMVVVGALIGFLTPALAAHSPNVHKGFDLYSAAFPGVLLGLLAVAVLYKTLGHDVPAIAASLGESRPEVVWAFCALFFLLCIAAGCKANARAGQRAFHGYRALLRDSGHKADFTAKYGMGPTLINLGAYGLFILAYYILVNLLQGSAFTGFNGVTMGIVFCMVCFGAAGSHPGNVWPIMIGYMAVSSLMVLLGSPFPMNAQAIMVGMCYASGLCPISGVYGWWAGILAGGVHYCMVTSIPPIHGGFSLYNGGFTALLVAAILVPQLEMFCKPKEAKT